MLMDRWLEGFAYKINIGFREFLIAGMISLIVVLVSVGYRSLKAAIQNPARSLRYE
jgi:putative ABC transport system permease protein